MSKRVDLKLDWASYKSAKFACENWHYSGVIPVGKLVKVGVWEEGRFIGCVIFGRGANNGLAGQFNLKQTECVELVRIALRDHVTPVSRIMMIAVKMLKKSNKGIRLVVSFADSSQGHHGGVYQAANWIYNGDSIPADEYEYKGKRWHGRAFRKSHGSHLNYVNKGLKIVKGSSKHRYLMPLDDDLRSLLLMKAKPYPKKACNKG